MFFNYIPTKIELNGPTLSFTGSNTLQPISTAFCPGGQAIFTGIATATFPTGFSAQNNGTISYKWYEVGSGALNDSVANGITGTATTQLTLSGLRNPQDNGRKFFLRADYVTTTYGITTSITGNALNESFDSDIVTLTVYPNISITSQPKNKFAPQNATAQISIGATASDTTDSQLLYQWYANGVSLNDGSNVISGIFPAINPTVTVPSSGWNGSGIYLDLSEYSSSTTIPLKVAVSEQSAIFHSINIPGIGIINENLGTKTFNLVGGTIYGPCTSPKGKLYIGSNTPVGGTNKLVVEEGGDDWDDMVLTVDKGFFKNYTSAPAVTAFNDADGTILITNASGISTTIYLSNTSRFPFFSAGEVYTIKPSVNVKVKASLRGGKGGSSIWYKTTEGGTGGTVSGIVTFLSGQEYKVVRASGGNNETAGTPGGGSGNKGGGGGGYTGIFKTSVSQANAILIAGGGGGGANDPEVGGTGGGTTGGNGQAGNKGGTQSAGGLGDNHAGTRPGSSGSALQGGSGAAGGGGGYYGGGGGGGNSSPGDDWAGGGGSGYINTGIVTSGTFTSNNVNNLQTKDGILDLEILTIQPTTAILNVNGSQSPNLSISCDTLCTLGINCAVSHPIACNSPLFSETASFEVTNAGQILNIERISQSGVTTALLTSWNLYKVGVGASNYTFSASNSTNPPFYSFYAAERDLDVFLDIYAGAGTSVGLNKGGQGGVSTIKLTLPKNEEHMIVGLATAGAVYVYRQSTLIAVVGGGGNAGSLGDGGAGGGVGVNGGNGGGLGAGAGGNSNTSITLNAIFGSLYPATTLRAGDTNANQPAGGRVSSHSKGDFWGTIAPHVSVGITKFRLADGTIITNSADITRGFKAGYNVVNTAGKAIGSGGNGGNGAVGGSGGEGGGGGGGAGFNDGSVTIVSTQQGGNIGTARVVIRTALV